MTPKETVLQALSHYRGDNTLCAMSAFKNCTPAQMREQYGQSGETRAQILAGYLEHDKRVDAAIAWIRACP